MVKPYEEFLSQLDQKQLAELSDQITNDFSQKNGYPRGAIPTTDFVTFSNYSSYRMTLLLLGKYHDWLHS